MMLMKASFNARKDEVTEAQKLYQAVLLAFPKNIRAQQGLATLNKLKKNPPQEVVAQLVNLYNQDNFQLWLSKLKLLQSDIQRHLPVILKMRIRICGTNT
jgi:hypothetical protein